jgi:hypothetical protein
MAKEPVGRPSGHTKGKGSRAKFLANFEDEDELEYDWGTIARKEKRAK